MYSNIRQVTHDSYLPISMQQKLRRDYYSGITHVDNMIGLLLKYVEDKNLMENTNIILMADHGQNLVQNTLQHQNIRLYLYYRH